MNSNLLETINILKRNKRYFASIDDYLKILTNLYNEISQKNLMNVDIGIKELDGLDDIVLEDFSNDEKDKIFDEILKSFNFESILKIKNINKLVLINSLFELLFIEINLIELDPNKKYHIQTEPIFEIYNKQDVVNIIKILLKMCYSVVGIKKKVLISIILFDTIFKNFQLTIDNQKFGETVKTKLDEFKKENDVFNEVCEKYNLEKNILDKWCEIMNGINYE
jgi:hypothetical protein